MAHIHYLHSDSFGNQESPQIKGMKTTHNAYGVKASFGLHNKPVNKFWEFSQVCALHCSLPLSCTLLLHTLKQPFLAQNHVCASCELRT